MKREPFLFVVIPGEDGKVHLNGPGLSMNLTACGYVDVPNELADGPATCKACIETVEWYKNHYIPKVSKND